MRVRCTTLYADVPDQRKTTRKRAIDSRTTVTLPTFAILMLRRLAEQRNEIAGNAKTVFTALESWIRALFSSRPLYAPSEAGREFQLRSF